eukprot:NODE_4_length_77007_cov_1.156642.p51 type:complete len:211 gc:universal NODE_4_length_77007_cov_1.156642:16726-17358(+)
MEDHFNELNTKETRYFNIEENEEDDKCRICLAIDHGEATCPFARLKNCFRCGKMGHESNCCVFRSQDIDQFRCRNRLCRDSPHFFEECPLIWRYYVINDQHIRPKATACLQCGRLDHLFEECPKYPIKNNRTPFTSDIRYFIEHAGVPVQLTQDVSVRPWNDLNVANSKWRSNRIDDFSFSGGKGGRKSYNVAKSKQGKANVRNNKKRKY